MGPYETVQEESNPYEPVVDDSVPLSTLHTTAADLKRRNAALLESDHTEEDLLSVVTRNIKSDPDVSISVALNAATQSMNEGIDNQVQSILENPAGGDLNLVPFAQNAKENIGTQYEQSNFERMAVEDSALTTDEFVKRSIAADDAFIAAAGKEIDDRSLFGRALDIGELFVPGLGSLSKDIADAASALTGGDASYFNSTEALLSMRRMWSKMSPQQKEVATPSIMKVLVEAADNNPTVAAQFAEYMTLPESALANNAVALDKVLDAMDGAAVFTGILKVAKGANAIARMRRLGRSDDAAENAAAIIKSGDEEAAKVAGTSQTELAGMQVPYNHEEMFVGIPDGMSKDIKTFNNLLDDAELSARGDVQVSRDALVANRLKELERNPEVTNVNFNREDGTISFTRHKDGAEPQEITYSVDTKDEWNVLSTEKVGAVDAAVSAPATKLVDDLDTVVTTLTTGAQLAQRSARNYSKVLKIHNKKIKSLKKSEKAKLNEVLMQGDEAGKEYTVDDLRRLGLNRPEAQEAYFQNRLLNNNAHRIKSNQLLDSYKFEGFDNYFRVSAESGTAARIVRDPISSLQGFSTKSVWNDVEGVSVNAARLTDDFLEQHDAVLVKFRSPTSMRDGNGYSYSVVERSQLRALQAQDVLPYREGYVTNIHERAKYFVTSPVRGTVDGVTGALMRTQVERAFSSKKKMDDWVKTATDESGALLFPNGRLSDKGWDSHFDRDYTGIAKNEAMQGSSGLFTGKRSDKGLIVDNSIDTAMADPFDATAKYYQDLSNRGILDRYRSELKQRWLNTYDHKLPPEFKGNFTEGLTGLERAGLVKGTPEHRAAKELHDHIRGATGMKSEDEIANEHWLRNLSELSDVTNQLYLKISKEGSLTGKAKSVSFHLNLGMLNPSQLLVQGSGQIVTMGAHPIAFTKAQPKMLQSLVSDASAAPLPKGVVHDMWRRSGFRETIDMNADMATAANANDTGKILNVFFNQGELMNRRAAFYTMYEVMKSRLGRELVDTDLGELVGEANRLTLNFSAVNKAKWQNGIPGLITQFQQVTEKSFNQIWLPLVSGRGSPLTKQEQIGAALGQSLFFGLSGIPFGEYIASKLDKDVADMGMSPEDAQVWKEGMFGQLPIRNNFSNRISMGQIAGNFYTKLFTGQLHLDGTKMDILRKGALGAFGTSVARALDGAVDIKRSWSSGDSSLFMQSVVDTAASLPSSLRNLYIVESYRNQQLMSSARGKPLSKTELSVVEQAFAGLGFPLQEIEEAYEAADTINQQERFMREVVDYAIKTYDRGVDVNNFAEWTDGGTMAKMFATLNPSQLAEAHRRVEKALVRGNKTLIERIGDDALKKLWLDNTTNPIINEAVENGQIR